MKLLIDLNHPGHVHLFKNLYFELVKRGHEVFVTTKRIKPVQRLLENIGIPYALIGNKPRTLAKKIAYQFYYDYQIARIVRRNRIQLGLGVSISVPHVSRITRMTSVMFEDDDEAVVPLSAYFAHPFSDWILSPDAIRHERFPGKHLQYSGYHTLAYLHPKRFTPDPRVLGESEIKPGEKYFVLRFNAFTAHHDRGAVGLSVDDKKKLIAKLVAKGKVFITTEDEVESEFARYRLPVPPEKIHSLMYYADMFVGDSQTMTSEASILGTPALKCNTFAGRLSVPNELEKKYQLCFSYHPREVENLFGKMDELLSQPDLKSQWKRRLARMIDEKIDVTAFFVWFVENYPESAAIMRTDPDFQLRFK